MKRRMIIVIAALSVLLTLTWTAYASPVYLVDDAHLLGDEEASQLETQLTQLSTRLGVDIVVVTVDSTDGKTPMDFADDCYDDGGYADDGILLLVSMEDNDWWVSTAGYGITAVTEAGLTYMSDRFVPYLSDGAYGQAFTEFADLCEKFIMQARTGDPYDSHNLPKDPFHFLTNLLIALAIGLVVGWIATGMMKAKLKSVRQRATADDYMTPGSMQLTNSRDLLLYTRIDRREKPKSNGGAATHLSSSGRSHGGGGGKF